MKKIISLTTALILSCALYIAAQESADVDVDVDVDVVVDANAVQPPVVNTDEIINIVAQKLDKIKNLTEEQKQKILEYVKQKLENAEVPKVQIAVEVCKKIEFEWKNRINVEAMKKEIAKIEKKIGLDIEDAKKDVEKLERKDKVRAQKAVEVLQNLVENGIPVEHALNVVKEAVKNKEELEVAAMVKLEEKLKNGEVKLPEELPEEIRVRIQERIKEQLEQRIQLMQQLQQQNQLQLQIQQQTQSQTEVGTPVQIQNVTSEQYQQMLQQYQQINTETSGCQESGSGSSGSYEPQPQMNTTTPESGSSGSYEPQPQMNTTTPESGSSSGSGGMSR